MKQILTKSFIIIGVLSTCLLTGCDNNCNSIETSNTTNHIQSLMDSSYNDRVGTGPYVDKDTAEFYYKNIKVILGSTKVSELLNEGADFYIRNTNNKVDFDNKTLSPKGSLRCEFVISDQDTKVETTIYNNSTETLSIKDCPLVSILVFPTYIKGNSYIYFNFPLDITPEEFAEKAGDIIKKETKKDTVYLSYTKHGDREFGHVSFKFENNKLEIISMSDADPK